MDFEDFEMLDRPVFLQFDHPGTLQPLFQERKDADGKTMTEVDEETGEVKTLMDAVGVNLFGIDSDQFQKRRRQILDGRIAVTQKGAKLNMSAKEVEQEGMQTLVACIHSFVNVEFMSLPLKDRGHYERFLTKHTWAKEQIDRGIADRSRFLKASNRT